MSEYQGCGVCKHTNVDAKEYPCRECIHNVATIQDYYKPMTNADRIRNMSDEELARVIGEDPHCERTECGDNCYECTLQWLQAEAKEGDTDE